MSMRTFGGNGALNLMAALAMLAAGSSGAVTYIYDVNDLQDMRNNLSEDYVLANDIDASTTATWNSGAGFEPVGYFTGSLDGAGYRIIGLTINRPSTNNVGLFSGVSGSIMNVGFMDGDVRGGDVVGTLVGSVSGTISYCYNTGAVSGGERTGGLVGEGSVTMSYCYNTGSVSGTSYVAGLVGIGGGTISYSYNSGNVTGSGQMGGISGGGDSMTVTNCYNVGRVQATNGNAGGVFGRGNEPYFPCYVGFCYNAGSVQATNIARPIALIAHTVEHCLWDTEASLPATDGAGVPGYPTAQMKQQATYTGWDFDTVWGIEEGVTYPYLLGLGPGDGEDFGDAPDPAYPTLLANDGARHIIADGLHLGAAVDGEAGGQPTADAAGDDTTDVDDEDGVIFTTVLVPGVVAGVDVLASDTGFLSAWIDFNADGDWDDVDDQVFADEPLVAGANALSISVPVSATPGDTYARFRFSSATGLQPTGVAGDGEVEDHVVTIEVGPPAHPADIDEDGGVNAIDIQLVINAALGLW